MKNIIAVIWDFDKTLVDGYMQDPIFEDFNVNSKEFWDGVNNLPDKYLKEQGVKVNRDLIYLNQFINDAKPGGRFNGLSNQKLFEYGKRLKFYPGVPEIFKKTKELLSDDQLCTEYGIRVEHYIVSTGFAQTIKGSVLQEYVSGIWGCELIENREDENNPYISEIAYTIDNTSKTRALFEINKGAHDNEIVDVNVKMTNEQRRIDFCNMIYIADGPSDVPAFSVVKRNGGSTFAIYPHGNESAFKQVEKLREDGRIDMFAEADYSDNTTAHMWICNKIKEMADRIKTQEKSKFSEGNTSPKHLI